MSFDSIPLLGEQEIALEIDIGFNGPHAYLIGISFPTYSDVEVQNSIMSLSLFGVVSYAAAKGKAVAQFDVKQAFTQTPMKPGQKSIFVRIDSSMVDIIRGINPELDKLYGEFTELDGSVIVELDYALYGTIEAGRMWYDYFKSILINLGYIVCPMDDCTFNRFDDSGIIIATIVLHVDDGFITADTEGMLDDFSSSLNTRLQCVILLGECWWCVIPLLAW